MSAIPYIVVQGVSYTEDEWAAVPCDGPTPADLVVAPTFGRDPHFHQRDNTIVTMLDAGHSPDEARRIADECAYRADRKR